tara:strand:- start:21 stop:506 length:486 start_codon:yes stop_codon:yes gene_type:complete
MKFFKSKKSKVTLEYTIQEENLTKMQKFLLDLGYELLRIIDFDDSAKHEIWLSNDKAKEVKLNVIPLESDASRSDIVNEVIDLWFELREINNTLKENLDFEDSKVLDNKTPIEKFNERVLQMSQNWSEDEVNNLFLYKEDIDPMVLTYLSLDGEDRRAITH